MWKSTSASGVELRKPTHKFSSFLTPSLYPLLPDPLIPKFAEMCPVFKNTEISREDIGQHMQTFAEEENIMSQPRRSLVGSYFGEKILLASPLIKWYLEHGLEVTHIYQVVEYTPVPCFQPFGEAVSDARRAGDVDPNKATIADSIGSW